MEKITAKDKQKVRCLSYDEALTEKDRILLFIRDSIAGIHTVGGHNAFTTERVYNMIKDYSAQAVREERERIKREIQVRVKDGMYANKLISDLLFDSNYSKPCPSSNHSTQEP